MRYRVTFSKEWTEPGEAFIEADSEDEARDIGREMLDDGSDDIEWDSANMDPGNHCVESVTEEPE